MPNVLQMMNNLPANYRYPGVTPFTTGQANIFFGRHQDTEDLFRLVRREPLVVLYGKSGLGKSSLLNAGIIPAFEKEGNYGSLVIRFGAWTEGAKDSPLDTTKAAFGAKRIRGKAKNFLEDLLPGDSSLWFHAKARQLSEIGKLRNSKLSDSAETQSPNTPISNFQFPISKPSTLLIFDQFEELFSYPEAQVRAFQEELSELLHTGIPLRFRRMADASDTLTDEEEDQLEDPLTARIVFAIRSDRMHLLDRLKEYLPTVLRHCFELKALSLEDAQDAILLPAKAVGDFKTAPFDYSPAAVAHLLSFLKDKQDGRVEGILLQMLCEHYERRLVEAQNLTLLDLPQIGDPEQVVRKYYEEKIDGLPQAQRLPARRLIEDGLVSEGEAMRLTLHESYIQHEFGVDKTLLEQLVDSRLLRSEPFLRGGYTYELSHDRLVPPVLNARNLRREEEGILSARQQAAELAKTRRQLQQGRVLLAVAVAGLLVAGYFWMDANKQKELAQEKTEEALKQTEEAKKQKDIADKALADFQQENAAKVRLKFDELERSANIILDAGGCPKDFFQQMRTIAKSHPDSLILNTNLKKLYAKNPNCK